MNGNGLNAVPGLDELIANPAKAATLPPEAAKTLLCGLAGVLPVLIAQASKETCADGSTAPAERWLTVEEVVSQFGITARWLYAHKRQLPHSQPSRKVLVFPEEKLRRWFATRKTG